MLNCLSKLATIINQDNANPNHINSVASSSSFGCRAGDHTIYPTTAILGQRRNIVWLQHPIRISQEVLNIIQVQCAWPSWLTFPMWWDRQRVFFHGFIIMETKHKTQKRQLLSPDLGNQRDCGSTSPKILVCVGVGGGGGGGAGGRWHGGGEGRRRAGGGGV